MASRIIGRSTCPECGFDAAHVKESEKCLYRYCPECGSQHYAKSQRQRADLTAKTRHTAEATATPTGAAKQAHAPATASASPTAAASETATHSTETPSAPAKRRGLFS